MDDLLKDAGNKLGLGKSFGVVQAAEVLRVPGLVLVSTFGEAAIGMVDICSSLLNREGALSYPSITRDELLREMSPAFRLYRSVLPGSSLASLSPKTTFQLSELAALGSGSGEFGLFAAAFKGQTHIGQGMIRSKTPHKTTAIFTPEGGRFYLETVGQTEVWAKRLA